MRGQGGKVTEGDSYIYISWRKGMGMGARQEKRKKSIGAFIGARVCDYLTGEAFCVEISITLFVFPP